MLTATEPDSYLGYAIEETEIADNVISSRRNKKAKTAFYLNKVESYIGDIVYFEYHNELMYKNYIIDEQFIQQTVYSTKLELPLNNLCEMPSPTILDENRTFRFIDNKVFNGKFLKKIWAINSSNCVRFASSVKKTLDKTARFNGQLLLKYRILENVQFSHNIVSLTYFPNTSEVLSDNKDYDRFYLTGVNFVNSVSPNNNYRLEYYNLENAPLKITMAQDYLGFYNGANANASLLPNNADKYLLKTLKGMNIDIVGRFGFDNNYLFLSNREPAFEFAKTGMLKKIHYPEKGFTEFEYEPVIKKERKTEVDLAIQHNVSGTCIMTDQHFINSELTGEGTIVEELKYDQEVLISLRMGGIKMNGIMPDYHDFVYCKITDSYNSISTSTIKKLHLSAEDIHNGNSNEEKTASLDFIYLFKKGHSYRIELKFGDENYNGNEGIITQPNSPYLSHIGGTLNFKYMSGYEPYEGLGIRIKRTKDYDSSVSTPFIKRYYYKSIHQLDESENDNMLEIFEPSFQ